MRANFDFAEEESSSDESQLQRRKSVEGMQSTMALIAASFPIGRMRSNGISNNIQETIPQKNISFGDKSARHPNSGYSHSNQSELHKRHSLLAKGGRMASSDFFHNVGKKIKRTHTNIKRSRLIHVFYVVALPAYTLLGAWVFQVLDKEHDSQAIFNYTIRCNQTRQMSIHQLRNNCSDKTFSECEKLIVDAIETVDHCLRHWHATHLMPTHSLGDYANAVIYATSVYTTIGYGNIAADTFGARLATIIYAIFGIPLFFAFLKDQGQLFSVVFMKSWKLMKHTYHGCACIKHAKRKKALEDLDKELVVDLQTSDIQQELMPAINILPPSRGISPDCPTGKSNHTNISSVSRDPNSNLTPYAQYAAYKVPSAPSSYEKIIGLESDRSTLGVQRSYSAVTQDSMGSMVNRKRQVREQRKVFIWAVIFLLIYLTLGSLLLMAMEPDWDLFTSIYFVFQSIALIGFGDVFPRKPSVVLINFLFIVIGIILFGMCYFILQEEIRQKAFAASRILRVSLQKRRLSRAIQTKFRGTDYCSSSNKRNSTPDVYDLTRTNATENNARCVSPAINLEPSSPPERQKEIVLLQEESRAETPIPVSQDLNIAPRAQSEDFKTPRTPKILLLSP